MPIHQTFFLEEVPDILRRIKPDTPNLWGSMNASKMLDHLTAGTKLFMAQREVEITTPEEKLPRYKAWLMTDGNFQQGAQKPQLYHEYEKQTNESFDKLKDDFNSVLREFDELTENNPEFRTVHPSFGRLNTTEVRQLQFKHVRHHFQQFGLLPRE